MAKDTFRYKEAVQEIEEILEKIENEDLDVDDLAGKVKRVSLLIKRCREKLYQTEKAIEKILDEMQED